MAELGPKTRELLSSFGLEPEVLDAMELGEVSWEVVDANQPSPDVDGELLLFHSNGSHAFAGYLNKQQVDTLIRTSEFERRQRQPQQRPSTFPAGTPEDWTGIRPDSDWEDLVRGYSEAVETLRRNQPRSTAAPYLYLCRHLLELQLKAIIMLGQEAMGLTADLPPHHDLMRLWTAAFPIVASFKGRRRQAFEGVQRLIEEYHAVDPLSYSFRYPVTPKNTPVLHRDYLLSFSHSGHAERFATVSKALDDVILQIRLSRIFSSMETSSGTDDTSVATTGSGS